MTFKENRRSGVLVHPTCFESRHGIGDLGSGAYKFIEFLQHTNQSYWQILPLGPTGYSHSPYQSFSSFAGEPMLISLDFLRNDGLLSDADVDNHPEFRDDYTDYEAVIEFKTPLLERAFKHYKEQPDPNMTAEFNAFRKSEKDWLENYALFMAIHNYHKGIIWADWPSDIAKGASEAKKAWRNKLKEDILYHEFLQFLFYRQWFALKKFANEKGIEIIGDVPIFVAYNSADVWNNQDIFFLDEKGYPTVVAGVPPDYFAAEGQLWGNPLYNWEICKYNNYSYWFKRMEQTLKCVDVLRIDHFRGFEAYWEVPYGAENAINGKWVKGPGKDFFKKLKKEHGSLPIIAEDLGIITKEVNKLRDGLKLPGMNVLQFGFMDVGESTHLPHNHKQNSVCYTGTHDNDTSISWYEDLSPECQDKFRRYLNTDASSPNWDLIKACLGSVSKTAMIPVQDILGQGKGFRMNIPGTELGNWHYRFKLDQLNDGICDYLCSLTKLYGRNIEGE